MLQLSDSIAPIDVAILPLFEKDGMDDVAKAIHQRCCQTFGIVSLYDGVDDWEALRTC